MTPALMVREFTSACGATVNTTPTIPGPSVRALRAALLWEEAREATDEVDRALADQDITAVAKELADLVYVAYGTALAYGIDLDEVLAEVHRSNMSKLVDGKPLVREDGKVLKGPGYSPANVAKVLLGQAYGPDPVLSR